MKQSNCSCREINIADMVLCNPSWRNLLGVSKVCCSLGSLVNISLFFCRYNIYNILLQLFILKSTFIITLLFLLRIVLLLRSFILLKRMNEGKRYVRHFFRGITFIPMCHYSRLEVWLRSFPTLFHIFRVLFPHLSRDISSDTVYCRFAYWIPGSSP